MENYHQLYARNCYYNRYGQRRCTRWSSWGRWVVLVIAVLFFVLLALSCCCLARRRRKRGVTPYYGTGWMAPNGGGKFGHNNQAQNYNPGYNNQQHQMHNYNQGAQGGYQQPYNNPPAYGGQQDSYYGGQQYGVQSPPQAYQGNSYAPPPGPPPGK